jgi:hypothetical protein
VVGGPIDCGSTCSVRVDVGSVITLKARADVGSEVASWNAPDCSGGECTFTLLSDVTARVNFRSVVPKPPASPSICTDRCRILVDEVIPGSAAIRGDLGLTLDSQGRPRVVSPKVADTCGYGYPALANSGGLDAVRDGTRWVISGKTWERGVLLARTPTAIGVLTGSAGETPMSLWLNSGDAAWIGGEALPFDNFRENTFVGDATDRFHVMATQSIAGAPVSMYAVWDGKWTATSAPVVPPQGGTVAMVLTGSAKPRVAFWGRDYPGTGLTQTLYVGDPLAKPDVALTSATVSSPMLLSFTLSSSQGVDTPQLLTQVAESSGTSLVYVTPKNKQWLRFDLGTNTSIRTRIGVDAYGRELWEYDEWSFWPVAVVAHGADVRLLYTTNHLTGEIVFTPQRTGYVISGGVNSQDLAMAWIERGQLKKQRLGEGFLKWTPGNPFPGQAAPLASATLDDKGRIHVVGEVRMSTSDCGSSLRYLVIGP